MISHPDLSLLFASSFSRGASRPYSQALVCMPAPYPQSNRATRASSRDHLRIGDPFAGYPVNKRRQTLQRMPRHIALVEAKRKLIDVSAEVLCAGVMVDAIAARA